MGGFDPLSAGIGAAGQLGGAVLGGKAQKEASKTQAQTADKALAYAKEKDIANRAEWDKAMAAYEARRNVLMQRYGISMPSTASTDATAASPAQAVPQRMAAPQGAQPGGYSGYTPPQSAVGGWAGRNPLEMAQQYGSGSIRDILGG